MIKFKKAIAVMLSAVMMLTAGSMPITVNAATVESDSVGFSVCGDFVYGVVDDSQYHSPGAFIYGYTGTDTEIVIPSEINGIPVTAISCEDVFSTSVTSIQLPDTLEFLDAYAFRGCRSLKSIVIPDSVTTIREYAFAGCSSAESLIIGKGISYLDNNVFAGCESLKEVEIPDNITRINSNAFVSCTGLKKVKIPRSVTSIAYNAFENHSDDLVIECYLNSAAHKFAVNNYVKFELHYLMGDIDLDGVVTIQDVTLMQRYCADEIEAPEVPLNCVDVDGNKSVDINDATAIQRLLVE
ncbi:MAG: leucine-rich repeat protein [Ruminococcus sp.]|nr:leucine-rich repeat protein [Ruminococcus sp.]